MKIAAFALGIFLSPLLAVGQCIDYSGKYSVDDPTYQRSYTIEFTQNGCNSITQTIYYTSGFTFGPITMETDSVLRKRWCNSNSCVLTAYSHSNLGLKSYEVYLENNQYDRSTDTTMVKLPNGDIQMNQHFVRPVANEDSTEVRTGKLLP